MQEMPIAPPAPAWLCLVPPKGQHPAPMHGPAVWMDAPETSLLAFFPMCLLECLFLD